MGQQFLGYAVYRGYGNSKNGDPGERGSCDSDQLSIGIHDGSARRPRMESDIQPEDLVQASAAPGLRGAGDTAENAKGRTHAVFEAADHEDRVPRFQSASAGPGSDRDIQILHAQHG